ncbi:MAG: serine/threonine protein kinase [Oscillatoriales cyanobacterium]|nr:MAG: serine/threonine protein kinase [Oscillatoriales cyanobacterium]
MNLAPTTVLQQGKYTINATLGIGGFGITYRATHSHLNQTVVLKTLNESLRQHPKSAQFQEQFIAEAQRLSRCQHSNIVRVIDFFTEAGQSFIAMDYIPGQTLAKIVATGGPLPEAQALHYIRQIASALSTVHHSGLLHRDLKPENIIRREDTHIVMLIDFGIARDFTAGTKQTHTNLLSPGYAPIEQYLYDGKFTPATDVYSLSATLYYLLSGQPPIAAPLRDRIPLPNLRQWQPNLSPGVEQAILRGLETEPDKRPQTVENWLAMLQEAEQLPAIKTKQTLRLPAPPPPQLTLLVFVVTSLIAGWMGFDLAWRYNSTNLSRNSTAKTESFPSLEDLLKSRDLSGPMFGQPSVESSPVAPPEVESLPTSTPDSSTPEPIESPEVSSQPEVSPSPAIPSPTPTPEPSETPTPIPEPEPSETPTPNPKIPIAPSPPIAPAPVPEVPPLPPEPPRKSFRSPTPPVAKSAETFSPPQEEPSPVTLPDRSPQVPIPSSNEGSFDSPIVPDSPRTVPEPTVPFPEPATN